MVTVRSAKAKGSAFEYDCQHSLTGRFKDIYRTSERGFQLQYDLQCDDEKFVVECKRRKNVTWNQAVKFFEKLEEVAPGDYEKFLMFQNNRQPCLVMYRTYKDVAVAEFKSIFGVPFEKHPSTRSNDK